MPVRQSTSSSQTPSPKLSQTIAAFGREKACENAGGGMVLVLETGVCDPCYPPSISPHLTPAPRRRTEPTWRNLPNPGSRKSGRDQVPKFPNLAGPEIEYFSRRRRFEYALGGPGSSYFFVRSNPQGCVFLFPIRARNLEFRRMDAKAKLL